MRRKAGILVCSLLLGLSAAGFLALPGMMEGEDLGNAGLSAPAETVAWWSLTCEMPNPEKLPVQVRFQWLKGLE